MYVDEICLANLIFLFMQFYAITLSLYAYENITSVECIKKNKEKIT